MFAKTIKLSFFVVATAAVLLLGACFARPLPPDPSTPTAVPSAAVLTLTPTVLPGQSPTSSGETPLSFPTPVATPFPLSIEAMRARQYPGSDLILEHELLAGANYRQYLASYLSEGLKIYGLLTIPDGEKPATGWPVIIFNHGYIPPKEYQTIGRYVAYVDLIARAGYIVFKPDYRGHGASEGEARGAYAYPDYLVDVLNAAASLKRYPDADPNRLGMWGHSMGGYLTLRSMVIEKDIKAGVIWGGVVASYPDMLTKWIRGPGAESIPHSDPSSWHKFVDLFGSPEQNPQFWTSISATSYLADISGPLQLHHGLADIEVPPAFSETLFNQLQSEGKYSELYEYPEDNHNISKYFNLAMQRSIEFFDKYVKNLQTP